MATQIIEIPGVGFVLATAPTFIASYPLRDGTYDVGNYHYNMSMNGSVPFTTIGGYQCAGDYNNGFIYSPYPDPLVTSLAWKPNWSVEGYIYCNSLTSGPVIFSWTSFGVAENALQILSDGTIRVFHGGDVIASAAGEISTGDWIKIKYIVTNGTNGNIYVNDSLVASGTSGIASQLNCVLFMIGRYALGGSILDGYVRNVKINIPALPAVP